MKVKDLMPKMEYLGNVISHNPVIPVLSYVLVKDGKFIGTDLQNRVIIPGFGNKEDEFLIPHLLFVNILKQLDLEIEIGVGFNSEVLTINIDGIDKFFITMENQVKDFPLLPDPFNSDLVIESGSVNNGDIEEIRNLFNYVSNDELRPATTGVYAGFKERFFAATDGHFLKIVSPNKIRDTECPINGVVLNKDCKNLFQDPDGSSIYFTRTKQYTKFVRKSELRPEEDIFIVKNIEVGFPEVMSFFSGENGKTALTVKMAKSKLLETLKLASVISHYGNVKIILTTDPDNSVMKVSLDDTDFGNKFIGSVPLTEHIGKPIKIAFNVELLIKIVEGIDDEEIFIGMKAPNKNIFVNWKTLLMPVMI